MTLDMWITVFSLGVGVYAFWPKRKARANRYVQSELQPRHTLPHAPRRRRRQPVPLPDLAKAVSREVSACKVLLVQSWHAAREGWQQGKYPYRYMSSAEKNEDLRFQPLILDHQPANDKRETTNEPNEAPQTTPEVAPPVVGLGKKRAGAMRVLFEKGLTDEQVARLYEHDPAAILDAMRVPETRAYQVAAAMRGDYQKALQVVASVVKGIDEEDD